MNANGDISLVAHAAAMADKRAFSLLVSRYQSQVRRFFLHQTLGDVQLSDDLAQDTFVKAYTSIARFHGQSAFSTWLYRIACNVYYDYARRQKREEELESANTHTTATNEGLRMDIRQALGTLRPQERTCVTLQLIDGLPIDRIAKITSMPVGTVKSHLARGKAKLTTYLKNNGYDRRGK